MLLRVLAIWFGLLALAILNGGFREVVLLPRMGRELAQALSTGALSALIFGAGWISLPWIAPANLRDAWTVGVIWVVLTLAFEFLGGHFLFRTPWAELLADYNLLAGRIWILIIIVTLLTPAVVFTWRRP